VEIQQEKQRAREAEASTKILKTCSYCGELGHNRRGCPKLAREQQEEEEKKRREQHGPLSGLAGVEEQRMPGGRQGVLVFPVPFQIEDAVNQVSSATLSLLSTSAVHHCQLLQFTSQVKCHIYRLPFHLLLITGTEAGHT